MADTRVKPKHEVNRRDDSDGNREGQSKPEKEKASKDADTGSAPEQTGTPKDG